jgi:hypothetical protein
MHGDEKQMKKSGGKSQISLYMYLSKQSCAKRCKKRLPRSVAFCCCCKARAGKKVELIHSRDLLMFVKVGKGRVLRQARKKGIAATRRTCTNINSDADHGESAASSS